jgi:recyclin-1
VWPTLTRAQATAAAAPRAAPRFTASANPAQVKRTFLAGFTDALLLPVTLVPRAVNAAGAGLVGAGAQGLALLTPQRWAAAGAQDGYSADLAGGEALFAVGDDDDTPQASPVPPALPAPALAAADADALDRLLSLDTALALIHAARASATRAETFAAFPAPRGFRVRDALAELCVLLLRALEGRHVAPGFAAARRRLEAYVPRAAGGDVGALVGFFELVHVGDTIASMVDVYFDKEIVRARSSVAGRC